MADDDECLEEFNEPEREELVHDLKAKWDTVNKKYQLMVRRRERGARRVGGWVGGWVGEWEGGGGGGWRGVGGREEGREGGRGRGKGGRGGRREREISDTRGRKTTRRKAYRCRDHTSKRLVNIFYVFGYCFNPPDRI